jgi:hypothetical protein
VDVELTLVEQGELFRAQPGQANGGTLDGDANLMKLDVACDFQDTLREMPLGLGFELHACLTQMELALESHNTLKVVI